jgi:TusA-related sulfurtransferase
MDAALTLDTLGRRCPIPVIELAKHLLEVAVGEVVAVVSDDEAARVDIPVWCRMKQQEYAGAEPVEGGTAYYVRRLT